MGGGRCTGSGSSSTGEIAGARRDGGGVGPRRVDAKNQIENWLLGGTGTSVATMASLTMRRLSTDGSGDSDSILRGGHRRDVSNGLRSSSTT